MEKVYQNALAHELTKRGYRVTPNMAIEVYYDDIIMGEYFADLVVNDVVILELKAVEKITEQHEAQLLNYLKATKIDVGLILNFGPKPQVVCKVYETARQTKQK